MENPKANEAHIPTNESVNLLHVFQRTLNPPAPTVSSIVKLATQFYYVQDTISLKELMDGLKHHPDIWALGVVDEAHHGVGIVVINQLQAKMSAAFAHEILGRRLVKEVMISARTFDWDKHILTVADQIESEVDTSGNNYYLLQNDKGQFAGIFSSKDLLVEMFRNYQRDLKTSINIQNGLIPEESSLQSDKVEIYSWCKMAKGIGGDFYAIKKSGNGHWVFMLCDVSGKGVAAGLVTTALAGMFSHYDQKSGLKQFIREINDFMLHAFKMEKYLTGVFMEYFEEDRRFVLYDMGHGHVRLLRKNKVHTMSSENPFLGFVPDLQPTAKKGTLHPGDLIVAFSDGLIEQANTTRQEFGTQRFDKLIVEHANEKLKKLVSLTHEAVKEFRGDQPRGDDMTMMALRVLE